MGEDELEPQRERGSRRTSKSWMSEPKQIYSHNKIENTYHNDGVRCVSNVIAKNAPKRCNDTEKCSPHKIESFIIIIIILLMLQAFVGYLQFTSRTMLRTSNVAQRWAMPMCEVRSLFVADTRSTNKWLMTVRFLPAILQPNACVPTILHCEHSTCIAILVPFIAVTVNALE